MDSDFLFFVHYYHWAKRAFICRTDYEYLQFVQIVRRSSQEMIWSINADKTQN